MHQHQVEVECKVKAISFLICSVSVFHRPSLSLAFSLSIRLHILPQSLPIYCQSAAVKFCVQEAEIAREEPCLDTGECSNHADDSMAMRAEEEKGGMETCRLLDRARAYQPQLDKGGESER